MSRAEIIDCVERHLTDETAIDYAKRVIKNSEKVILAGLPATELRLYTTDKGLEMLKRVVELADREPCEDAKRCSDCKYYGTFTCECPYDCNDKTKRFWEIADNLKMSKTEPCEDMGRYDPYTDSFVNDDCIRRQAVMELPRYTTLIGEIVYLDGIKALPSVYPKAKTEWISVSERLPEEVDNYLTSIRHYGEERYVQVSFFDGTSFKAEVEAWMPLPEPYKEESEDV